mmetsp:Transcript_56180/g.68710  ORF Transcript_56180/g.68710 Transcript_56180/m.68710 type:complete len:132 (+) Transcript_56180:62-457(+)
MAEVIATNEGNNAGKDANEGKLDNAKPYGTIDNTDINQSQKESLVKKYPASSQMNSRDVNRHIPVHPMATATPNIVYVNPAAHPTQRSHTNRQANSNRNGGNKNLCCGICIGIIICIVISIIISAIANASY